MIRVDGAFKSPNMTVSVVIPYFNSASTIERAVESVRNQTYEPNEIIIVDDGSTKEQLSILQSVSKSWSGVKIISLRGNMGPASTRNAGWDEAESHWVAFLDSDDAWHPSKLELQMKTVSDAGGLIDLVSCNTQIIEDVKSIGNEIITADRLAVSELSKRKLLFSNSIATSSVLIKSCLPIRFTYGEKYAEDYELWLRVTNFNGSMLKIEAPLVYQFKAVYGASGLSSHMLSMAAGELKVFKRLFSTNQISVSEFIVSSVVSVTKSLIRIVKNHLHRMLNR